MAVVEAGERVVFRQVDELLRGLALVGDVFVDPQPADRAAVGVGHRIGQLGQDAAVVEVDLEAFADLVRVEHVQDVLGGVVGPREAVGGMVEHVARGAADQLDRLVDRPHVAEGRIHVLDAVVAVLEQDADAHARQQRGHAALFALRQQAQFALARLGGAQVFQAARQRKVGAALFGDVEQRAVPQRAAVEQAFRRGAAFDPDFALRGVVDAEAGVPQAEVARRALDAVQQAGQVLGVLACEGRRRVCLHVLGRNAVDVADTLAGVGKGGAAVGAQQELEDHARRVLADLVQPRGEFRARGDVLGHADHPGDPAVGALQGFAARRDRAQRAVGPHDAEFGFAVLARLGRGAEQREHGVAILRVQRPGEALEARRLRGRVETVDATGFVRPEHCAGGDVPFPTAEMRHRLGLGEPAGAFLDIALRLAPRADVGDRAHHAQRLPAFVGHRVRGDLDVHVRAVGAPRLHLAAPVRRPAQSVQHRQHCFRHRHEIRRPAAERVFRAVEPPHFHEGRVHVADAPVQPQHGHGSDRGFDRRILDAQCLVGLNQRGGVRDVALQIAQRAVRGVHPAAAFEHPARLARTGQDAVGQLEIAPRDERLLHLVPDARRVVGMDEPAQRDRPAAEKGGARIAGQLLGIAGQEQHGPVAVVGAAVDDAAQRAEDARHVRGAAGARFAHQQDERDAGDAGAGRAQQLYRQAGRLGEVARRRQPAGQSRDGRGDERRQRAVGEERRSEEVEPAPQAVRVVMAVDGNARQREQREAGQQRAGRADEEAGADGQAGEGIVGRQHEDRDAGRAGAIQQQRRQARRRVRARQQAAAEFQQRDVGQDREQTGQGAEPGRGVREPRPFDEFEQTVQQTEGGQQPEIAGERQGGVAFGQDQRDHAQREESQPVGQMDRLDERVGPARHGRCARNAQASGSGGIGRGSNGEGAVTIFCRG